MTKRTTFRWLLGLGLLATIGLPVAWRDRYDA